MNKRTISLRALTRLFALSATACVLLLTAQARVLDDFNDNTSTDWAPFVFGAGAGSMVEQNGQYKFELPGEVTIGLNSALFCASTKTSELFTLKEGRTLEFRVDVIKGGGPRSYATLGFIPTSAGGPQQLKGYTLSKSPTDVLLVKGINQYFVDDDTITVPPKQDNITLVLSLKVKGGNVIIHGEILDKDQNDAVIWERTVVDTPVADPMQTGTDSPPTPYLGDGNFVLYLYANYSENNPTTAEFPFQATYDNAEVFVTDSAVLDDFNDNTITSWDPFSFAPPYGYPLEQNGQFVFEMPGAFVAQVGSQVFSASTKTAPLLEVKEGERIELSVDIITGGLKDSFAILAFIPTTSGGPSSLKGYSFAKSTTDVLIVKGINQYFVAASGPEANLKQDNTTLVLSLTTRNGIVTLDAKVLDKDASDAVIWHRRVVDSPLADVMDDGTDSPPAPYIGTGNFTLMLFADYSASALEDPYRAIFDNAAIAKTPDVVNAPPLISDALPTDRANFLPAPAQISFKVTDDQPLVDDKISVNLNGTNYTKANGLTVTGAGTTWTATLGGLGADIDYTAILRAEDSNGEVTTKTIYFDTFATSSLALEVENYNFGSGQFIDDVLITPEQGSDPKSYSLQVGTDGTDYFDTQPGAAGVNNNPYRSDDKVRAARSRDNVRAKYIAAGGADAGVYDYDVGDLATGEWLNYTHTFPEGYYEVYLREAIANLITAESVLEKVTSDPTQINQTTQVLGSFLGALTGFTYRNFALTDASGLNKIVLHLSGVTTLRLRHVTGDTSDGARLLNYLVFIPVSNPGVQRAYVSSVEPAAGTTVASVEALIRATIQNRDTTVVTSSIKLEVNGGVVSASVVPNGAGATVNYNLNPLPPPNLTNLVQLSFKDNAGTDISTTWKFVLSYVSLDPALRVTGAGKDRGFNVRVVQAQLLQNTENSLTFAENLLRPGTTMLVQYETNVVSQLINYSQSGPGTAEGSFPDDELIPGLDPSYSTDDIAMEITTYLDLAAGKHRFGANCDDGYKVQAVPTFTARDTGPMAFHNGGPANETYDFYVSQPGLYPFRMVWYERGGGANVEWFQSNFTDGARVLLNSDTAGTVKAFATLSTPAVFGPPTLSGGQLTITWTGTGVLQESSDLKNWTDVPGQPNGSYTVPVGTAAGGKFYRIKQ
jgi:hypothetical protein